MQRTLLVIGAAALVAACESGSGPAGPGTDPMMSVVPIEANQAADPGLAARQIDGFGGMFIDAAGQPTVYLTDMSQAARARRVLANFAEDNGASPLQIKFLPAAFRYTQLNGWYERTWPEVMTQAGTVFSDLDEANNHILFGVERAGLATAVSAVMRAHGVPDDAYSVEVVSPIKNLATLRDEVNPKVAGLQIHFGGYLCSLGFNASVGGVPHFVTASHCTNKQGGVEGTQYYQPTSTVNPTVIATEVKDPVYVKGDGVTCPRGKNCRYSDSSLEIYSAGVSSDLGGLATVALGGSLTITGTSHFTSESDASTTPVPVGGSASKTGRTTGKSTGTVTNTCVNTAVSGGNIMQLCQTFVNATVGGGDSGSGTYSGNALVGILWGGNSQGTQFVFSPLKSVKAELGAFVAH